MSFETAYGSARGGDSSSSPVLPDIEFVDTLAALLVGRLTRREREIFLLLAWGPSNRQLARRLGITERTVKAHVSQMMFKAGAGTRAQLCVMSYSYARSFRPPMGRDDLRSAQEDDRMDSARQIKA
jgi:DNA-binding NarL/FixJ family response regulator